jgi:hypothetical protein
MRGRLLSLILISAAAVALCAGRASAQTISGLIAGTASDAQGKPLSSVAITALNPNTGRRYQTSTDDRGYFRILEVPPGAYEVTAELAGFQTETHTQVRVNVNRTTTEDFPLKVATKEETITVVSTAPMEVMDSPTLSTSFNDKQVVEIPVLTRDVNNLALLAPGVLSVRTFSFASTLVPFSVNGSRGRDNNFTIDSVDNNEPLFGGAASQLTNTDIFQEYTILTGQLKAEFGRNTGAAVNAITKSGSNNLHGTVFGFGQGDIFDATNRVEQQALLKSPEPFYDTIFGATVGGPIKKDKSFFFVSYQWDRLSDNLSDIYPVLSNYPATPADVAVLRGLPSTPALQAYLATPSVSQVPGLSNTNCFNGAPPQPPTPPTPLYRAKNPCLITPTAVNAAPGTPLNFNVWNVANANTFNLRDHQLSGRWDQRLNNVNDLYARYLFDDLASPLAPLASAGVSAFSDVGLLPDWKTLLRQRTQSFLLDHRYYRASSLNEFRVSYSRVSQGQGTFNVPANVRNKQSSAIIGDDYATLGTIGGLGLYLPQPGGLIPSAGSLITLGQDGQPSQISSNTYQIQDNFSYTYKRHNMKFGANFVKIDSNVYDSPDNLGFYLFSGFGGLNGFQAFATEPTAASGFITNASAVSQRLVNVKTDSMGNVIGLGQNGLKIREFDQFYFAQDDWRVRDNLTFSFGLRYENFGQPINSVHNLNSSAPFVNTDNKDYGPRLGFAWSPKERWVVRGGYGVAYSSPILNVPLLIWQSGPVSPLITTDSFSIAQVQPGGVFPNRPLSIANIQGTNSNTALGFGTPIPNGMVQGCSQYLDLFDLFAGNPLFPSRAFNGNFAQPVNIPIVNCSDQDTVDKNLKNPYVQSWSLGVQHEIGSNYLAEVDYVGSKGTRLLQRVDMNPYQGWNSTCVPNLVAVVGTGLAVPGQCLFNRLNDSHGDIREITNGGSSTYHALQASVTKRWGRTKIFGIDLGNISSTLAYTWSHLIDNTSEIFGPGFRSLQGRDISSSTILGVNGLGILLDPYASAPVESVTPLAQTFNQTTKAERASSSFDRRHRYVSSFLWEPFPTRNAFLRGWQLGGITTYQSGQPFSPLNASPLSKCADANGDGSLGNDRPNIGNPKAPLNRVALISAAADPLCLPTGTYIVNGLPTTVTVAYVDLNGNPLTAAQVANSHFIQRPLFVSAGAPSTVTFPTNAAAIAAGYAGSAGRNSLVGPTTTNLDLSLFKNITFGERYTLQLRWEVYDVFNKANPGGFNGSPYISNASGAPAFAYSAARTGASITGGIPENTIDASNQVTAKSTFLSQSSMNTSSRRMQFGIRFIF